MKTCLFLILLFKSGLLIAQTNDTITSSITGVGIDRAKERQKKLTLFADSINNYMQGVLPSFLFDACFDLQSNLWDGFHSPVSLRWKVLQKISNAQALKHILDLNDERLKKKCNYEKGSNPAIIIPMIRKSFRQLVRKRYNQIN